MLDSDNSGSEDVAPMIDVCLLLLSFFFTSSLVSQATTSLPQANNGETPAVSLVLVVEMPPDGLAKAASLEDTSIYFKDEPNTAVRSRELRELITARMKTAAEGVVIIEADRDLPALLIKGLVKELLILNY